MSQADLEVNRKTRSVFVRHWIDLGHLSIKSINGKVTVRGKLTRVFGSKEELTPALVDTIFNEIKRDRSVKRVNFHLDNWSNDTGIWRKIESSDGADGSKGSSGFESGEGGKTYVIDDQ